MEISLCLGFPDNQISLHFGVPDNQISLRFMVPDNQISLHLEVPDNHQNGVKFGCWDPQTEWNFNPEKI